MSHSRRQTVFYQPGLTLLSVERSVGKFKKKSGVSVPVLSNNHGMVYPRTRT
jgi:hypothetical protein